MTVREVFDVAVIGAGVGGSCAAIALARRGVRVALLEAGKLPHHKVCGEFLSPESRAVFQRLGVNEAVLSAQPIVVSTACIVASSRKGAGERSLEIPLPAGALALSRFRLDQVLWDAAKAGGVLGHQNTRVRKIEAVGDEFIIQTNTENFQARAVIAAVGRSATWLERGTKSEGEKTDQVRLRHFGIKTYFRGARLEPGVVELHGWRGGYCGLTRVEDGLTDVCLLARYNVMERLPQRAPDALWAWLLRECPSLARRLAGAEQVMPWLTTGNVAFETSQTVTNGVLRVGDAAGYIHPLTGDGMAMAARSGELAAAVLAAQLRGGIAADDAAMIYAAAWQREFGKRLKWAGVLQPLLMSPLLTTASVALLSHAPALARAVVLNTRGL